MRAFLRLKNKMLKEIITTKPACLRQAEACKFVGIGESTLQKLVREGKFPKPRVLSGRCVGYVLRELEAWVESRPVSNLLPPPNTGAKKAVAA